MRARTRLITISGTNYMLYIISTLYAAGRKRLFSGEPFPFRLTT